MGICARIMRNYKDEKNQFFFVLYILVNLLEYVTLAQALKYIRIEPHTVAEGSVGVSPTS